MRWPLRYQIMLPMAAVMLLTVAAVGGLGAVLAVRAVESHIASRLAEVTRILEDSNFPLTDSVLRQMRALSGAEMFLVDESGQVIATSDPALDVAPFLAAGSGSESMPFTMSDRRWIRNHGYFHTTMDLAASPREAQPTLLHILYSEAEYRQAWQRAVYPSLGIILLALPIITLLAAVTAKRISDRVGRLQRQVERIARGDFQRMTIPERDDEIRALGEAVNRMAVMLAEYEHEIRGTERMRTLAILGGGIAHQLRNSATGCAMALDLHGEECTLGESCESLSVAKRQLQLMEEYLQRFLQLGQHSDGSARERINLAELVDELIPLVQPAARHAGVDLHWPSETVSTFAVGDPQSLRQLLINLLLNAIEAAAQAKTRTGAPGCVWVLLERNSSSRISISIRDTGQGPGQSIQDRLFEPFATDKPDGVGLGLAVSRDIAERHGGKIYWERAADGTRFVVELPCELMESELVYAAGR